MANLSVIVPVYNTKKYLRQCIDSILNQSYPDIEVILVDDGSTDGSEKMCDAYKKIDERVQVIHQDNKGGISARLSGLKNAKGEYITFVDSDDWISQEIYEKLMGAVKAEKCDIVSMGYTLVSGGKEQEIDDAVFFGTYRKDENIDVLLSNMMYSVREKVRGVHPSLCTKIMKKELLTEVFDKIDLNITIGDDAAIFYPCCLNANSIRILKDYDYYYRVHKGSMCRTVKSDTIGKIYLFYQYMRKTIASYNEKYDLYTQLKNYVWSLISYELGQTFDIHIKRSYIFPYTILDKKTNFILYGAGEVGESYHQQIVENQYSNIVAWVDKNKCNEKNSGIVHPKQIHDLTYSKILIAVREKKLAEEIMGELADLGIDREKMIWVEPQMVPLDIK